MTTMATLALATITWSHALHGQPTRPTSRSSDRGDRTTGFMVGVHTIAAPGVAISGEDVRDDFHTTLGGGAGAMLGYGFTPMLSGYVSVDVAKQGSGMSDLQGSFGLVHFEIGARVNVPIAKPRMLPFVSVAVGRRALGAHITDDANEEEYDAAFSGGMLALGGGVQYFASPSTTFETALELGTGSFGTLDIDGDRESVNVGRSSSIRLRAGIVWRP
jgi:hypothetical protein